jgi:hypothetical protein
MGPRAGLDVVMTRKKPALAQNQNMDIQPLASNFTDVAQLALKARLLVHLMEMYQLQII